MTTPEQIAASEAANRLPPAVLLDIQTSVALIAVRALINAHPNPAAVRQTYDQLLGQLLASPVVLKSPDRSMVLKDLTATLFRPPVVLDTAN